MGQVLPGIGVAAGLLAAVAGSSVHFGNRITAGSTANSINILLPVGAAEGDHAVYGYSQDAFNNGTLSTDGGATETLTAFGQYGNMRRGLWKKQLTSTDITNGYIQLTFASGAGDQATGWVGLWRGGSPVFTVVGETNSGGADGTTATLSDPSGAADYLAHAFLDDDQTTVSTWPTSYTTGRVEAPVGTAGSGGTGAVAVALNVDPGAETFVFGTADEWITVVVKVVV